MSTDHSVTIADPTGCTWSWAAVPWHVAQEVYELLGLPDLTTGIDGRRQPRHGDLAPTTPTPHTPTDDRAAAVRAAIPTTEESA